MGKDAPSPPNPYEVAEAQKTANIETAREQARLAMTGQDTPRGTLRYVRDPSSPSGFRAITELSPEEQALFGMGQDLQAQYGGIAGEQLGRVGDVMADPFDISAARGTEISDIQRTFLDPMWDARSEELRTALLNRGIRPGSEEYEREMLQFNNQRSGAYNSMFLDAWTKANAAALAERNQPMSELSALRTGYMPGATAMPQWATSPTPGVAPTDVAGPVMQAYQAELNAHNNQMGGLFGLGQAAMGGWARAGFPGASAALAMISDRRVKTDIRKVGDDPRGWPVFVFRYIWDNAKELGMQIGFMAQDVEKVRPDAVVTDPATGIKMVNYEALALS